MTEPCIRCGIRPAEPGDRLHCEPCFQIVCDEIHQAELMEAEGLDFMSAVERLMREWGLR